jgi:hypothetical protein
MERGLLWLPLLILFFGLAWAGWNEYQKVDTYQQWAQAFERAKYDIYAALGQTGDQLTWGKPTRRGILGEQHLSLTQVKNIGVRVGDRLFQISELDEATLAQLRGKAHLELVLQSPDPPVQIPYTDAALAGRWAIALAADLPQIQRP